MSQDSEQSSEGSSTSRATLLLALGATAGLVLAAGSLVSGGQRAALGLPSGVVAQVNDTTIREEDYLRILAGVEKDTRSPIDDERRRHVLDRLIDEELLVQRALEMGLAQLDRRVRADLTSSLISSIVGEVADAVASEDELREFFDGNREFFTAPGRIQVRQIFFRVPREGGEEETLKRASEARARWLAGESFEDLRRSHGNREISPVPAVLLPPAKLREYIGPSALRVAMELPDGGISEPLRSGTGVHVIQRVGSEPPRSPSFEEIRAQVESEWRRRQGDLALRSYLDDLRDRADVVVVSELP